ncbi:copper amine oxidase N-terminal domain-containing protein [Ferviditalea candida]|uniref:Copper amine oxidase N-terminal domain-containing protein n=1 Tax=Ferviditalea candida TaxID=3108399 RepID=A0ABU5ZJ12_9BACL|nr:copper amine oxidase N-terminal domain-containing protein [Paenibacillaceae bacterium T2]
MKKAIVISLIIILSLVGCNSTVPSYRDAIVKNMSIDKYESRTIVKLNLEPLDNSKQQIESNKEMKLFLDLLKSGIIFTQSVDSDKMNFHLKVSFADPAPLVNSEYWRSPEDPSAEFVAKDGLIYVKTSSEDKWIHLDDNAADTPSPFQGGMVDQDKQKQFKSFIQKQVEKFASQFDYKLRSIKDLGYTTLTTPAGQESVKHLQINLTIDDYIDFLKYFIDNLVQYENFDEFFAELQKTLGLTAENTKPASQNLVEFKQLLYFLRGMLDQYSQKSIEDQLNTDIEFSNTNDVYINDQSYIVGGNYHFDWALKNRAKNAGLKANLNIETTVWNINQDIQLPQADLDNAVNFSVLTKDRAAVNSLGDSSFVRKLIIENYFIHRGIIRRDISEFPFAELDGKPIYLDAAPYEINGTLMIPLNFIGKLTNSDPIWNGQTREAAIQTKNTTIKVKVGSKTILVNGKKVEMPLAAATKNGRTFVPLRSIAENLGVTITWFPTSKEIHLEYRE